MLKLYKKDTIGNTLAFSLILVGIFAPTFTLLFFYKGLPNLSIDQVGKLGPVSDWISGLMIPFFTFASFIVLFLAYHTQKEELKLTREELISTRDQFEKQTKLMDKQRFEGTFFNLLSIFRKQAAEMEKVIYDTRKNIAERLSLINMYPSMTDETNSVDKFIKEYFNERRKLVPYFRLFEYLINIIECAGAIEEREKEELFKLVEATMTEDELLIIFTECLSRNSDPFVQIIKKRRILEHYLNYRQRNIPTFMRDSFIISQNNYDQK